MYQLEDQTCTLDCAPMPSRHWELAEQADTHHELRAQVRSGEYFTVLATHLEQLAEGLQEQAASEAAQLQRLAEDLFWLQPRYQILSN